MPKTTRKTTKTSQPSRPPARQRADRPFYFCTQLDLKELTGLRASTLPQLVRLIKELPGSSIFYHTHHFVQQYHLLKPEPPSDFAHWVERALGDARLAELLASVDTIQYPSIRALRERLLEVLEQYLRETPTARLLFARAGEELHAIRAVSFVIPTAYVAHDLKEFREALEHVTVASIYFHLFEARLRLERSTNDFSAWCERTLGERGLARQFEQFDPYTATLEEVRARMLAVLDERLRA